MSIKTKTFYYKIYSFSWPWHQDLTQRALLSITSKRNRLWSVEQRNRSERRVPDFLAILRKLVLNWDCLVLLHCVGIGLESWSTMMYHVQHDPKAHDCFYQLADSDISANRPGSSRTADKRWCGKEMGSEVFREEILTLQQCNMRPTGPYKLATLVKHAHCVRDDAVREFVTFGFQFVEKFAN